MKANSLKSTSRLGSLPIVATLLVSVVGLVMWKQKNSASAGSNPDGSTAGQGIAREKSHADADALRGAKTATPGFTVADLSSRPVSGLLTEITDIKSGANIEVLVHELASRGVAAITEIKAALATATNPVAQQAMADALARIGAPEAVEALVAAIHECKDEAARARLVQAFDNLSSTEGLENVVSFLGQPCDPAYMDAACRTLARMAQPESVDYLREMWGQGRSFEAQQGQLSRAMSAIANPAAVPALEQVARDASAPALAEAAASSLSKIGTTAAVTALVSMLEDTSVPNAIRDPALEMLASVRNPSSTEMLRDISENSSEPAVREAAAEALSAVLKLPASDAPADQSADVSSRAVPKS